MGCGYHNGGGERGWWLVEVPICGFLVVPVCVFFSSNGGDWLQGFWDCVLVLVLVLVFFFFFGGWGLRLWVVVVVVVVAVVMVVAMGSGGSGCWQ